MASVDEVVGASVQTLAAHGALTLALVPLQYPSVPI